MSKKFDLDAQKLQNSQMHGNRDLRGQIHISKSIVTKPKNDQGKSYSDRTDKETERQKDKETDIENYNIDFM